MESFRSDALPRLRQLENENLYDLALRFGTRIALDGKKNKGWVGQALEDYLGLESKNLQKMDGADYELKSTTLTFREGRWDPKETIKVTQLNPKQILNETFETSALWNKLSRWIFVGVTHESEQVCRVVRVAGLDLVRSELVGEIREFWEEVQALVANGELKDLVNFGSSDGLIQLRPTGDGKTFSTCPVTGDKYPARAFYATKRLLRSLLA